MKKIFANKYVQLFTIFFKIGLFTFGGGYAMISLIQHEFVNNKKWIDEEELIDMIAVAESTPGPLAINSATYVGFHIGKFFGSLIATIGVVLPSFVIITILSFFLDQFLEIQVVAAAFKGIKVGVSFLIFTVAINLLKQFDKMIYTFIVLITSATLLILVQFFNINLSTMWIIICGAILGILYFSIADKIKSAKEKKI